MADSWVTRAQSGNSTPVEITDDILEEKGVILLQGSNVYGDPIFSYLQLSIRSMQELRERMRKGEKFLPADFGEVIAAGKGDPGAELRSEMAVTYNLIDTPRQNKPQAQATQPSAPAAPQPAVPSGFAQPSIWDD